MKRSGNNRGRKAAPKPAEKPIDPQKITAPTWMPQDGADLCGKLAHIVANTTTQDDLHLFMQMCAAYGFAVEAAREVKEHGVTIKDERGIIRRNPATQVFRDQLAMFNALSGKFGLSPSDRAKLIQSQPAKDIDPLEELLAD